MLEWIICDDKYNYKLEIEECIENIDLHAHKADREV